MNDQGQQLVARIKRSSKYAYQAPDGDWFDVHLNNIGTAEMIETVMLCYLGGNRTTEGSLGGLVDIGGGQYRVTTATGITVIVRGPRGGRWAVAFKGFRGEDSELIVAASNALDGGSRRDASTIDDALRF